MNEHPMNKLAKELSILLAIFALTLTAACHSGEQQAPPTSSKEQATEATEQELAEQRRKSHAASEGRREAALESGTSLENEGMPGDHGDYAAEGRRGEDPTTEDVEGGDDVGDGETGGSNIGT